jgi:hypothetical protein
MDHRFEKLYRCATRVGRLNGVTLLALLSGCGLLSTCDRTRRPTTDSAARKPVLSANPNPVPSGDIEEPLGTTTITWDTGNGAVGELYVKVNREPEKFMSRAPSGTQEVHWIQFDSLYEFRLYSKKRSKLLATLEVTRDD